MRNTCLYDLAGTITFRLASRGITKNFITKETWGTNLQNIEKSMRKMYVPDKGKIFVQVDQSGAEALIVSYLTAAGNFRDLFLYNVKPHVFVALHLFAKIWEKKINEMGGDIKLDVEELLNSKIPDLHLHPFWPQVDKLIKSSDDWQASERYYYIAKQVCHCVSEDTKVLTKNGWFYISEIDRNSEIAVCDKDLNIKFEIPKEWFEYSFDGNMAWFKGDELDQLVTPEHRILYESNNKLHTKKAERLINYSYVKIPNTGLYTGGSIAWKDFDIKLLVAIQADSYIASKHNIRFRLKKKRKIERLRSLLKEGNYEYKEEIKDDSVTEFYIYNMDKFIALLGENKEWNYFLLDFSTDNLKLLIDELKYWDGSYHEEYLHKREEYNTSKYKCATWIKTVCHLIGKQGTIGRYEYCGPVQYRVGINNRRKARVKGEYIHYKGQVYCPSTSTGFFLVKRNGKISITGNSHNYDIKSSAFQLNTLEKSRGKIVLTKKQADDYGIFYHSLFPEIHEWHREVRAQIEATHYLFNLFGFPRFFSGEISERMFKEAYAFIPQSTVGTITNIAVSKLQQFIEQQKVDWDILANTHDSYLCQCPVGEELECGQVMQGFINMDLMSPRGEPFKMKSEAVAGYNWAPYKKNVNEEGLKALKI